MPDALPDLPVEMENSIGEAIEAPAETPAVIASNLPTQEAPAPEGTEQTETATDAEAPDSFTGLDPNALPEELQPYYKSMQADYTRKLQQAAPWRGLGEELGVDSPDSIKEAVELYTFLQDENNVRALSESLNKAFGTGEVPAAQPQAAPTEYGYDDESPLENPQLAELKSQVEALQSNLQQRDAVAQEEAVRWQLMGEMNRQEAVIKEQHPDWGDDEWNAIWSLSVSTDGNLVDAANYLDAAANSRVTRLLNGKAAVAQTPGLSAPAPNRIGTAVPDRDYSDPEMKGLTAEAVEFVRGVVNQSE